MLTRANTHAQDDRPGAAGSALLAADHVSISFRGKPVLETVSIAVHEGEIVTLIGPNGAGKTTLARVLLGLAAPTSGRVVRRPGLTVG
ncbi:ATP-binding cassette domain-containing protein, partial [Rhodomicrobium udaipurense]